MTADAADEAFRLDEAKKAYASRQWQEAFEHLDDLAGRAQCDGSPRASMLLGYIALKVDQDHRGARKEFLAAARAGSQWGLRYAAETYRGRSWLGFSALTFAAVALSPFLRIGSEHSPYH